MNTDSELFGSVSRSKSIELMASRQSSDHSTRLGGGGDSGRAAEFRSKVEAGAAACARGDFSDALQLYTDAIQLDPSNHVLFSNRSAILCKLSKYRDALGDADTALQLKPTWTKAYYRKGYAFKCMGDYLNSMLAYANGLSEDSKNAQLLNGLLECARQSPIKARFDNVYAELSELGLEGSPFVVVSVVGQEVLAMDAAQRDTAVRLLLCALRIGTTSLKLKQSVLSSLSSAYWALGQIDRAAEYMQEDLCIAVALGDSAGEIRAHANLAMVFTALGKETSALDHYHQQLQLVMTTIAKVLASIGDLHSKAGDHQNAVTAHQQCIDSLGRTSPTEENQTELANQLTALGNAHVALGHYQEAERCFRQHIDMLNTLKAGAHERIQGITSIAHCLQNQGRLPEAIATLKNALQLSKNTKDYEQQCLIYGIFSTIYQSQKQWVNAKKWAEMQLRLALKVNNRLLEGSACSCLAGFYERTGDFENAKRLYSRHLQLAAEVADKKSLLRARHNVARCLDHLGQYDLALTLHKAAMTLAKELHDVKGQRSAHEGMAGIYERLGRTDQAILHLQCNSQIASQANDTNSQLRALNNVGQFYARHDQPTTAVEYLQRLLMLAQEQSSNEMEAKACAQLGTVHMALGKQKEAVRYFEQELTIVKDVRNHVAMADAYRRLGEAHMELGELDEALDSEKYCLALAHITSNEETKLQAMTIIGRVLTMKAQCLSSIKVLAKCLKLAKSTKNLKAEAAIFGHIGAAYSGIGRSEKTIAFLKQELKLCERSDDTRGKFNTLGRIANHYANNNDSSLSLESLEQQLIVAQQLNDRKCEAVVLRNLAKACTAMGMHKRALNLHNEATTALSVVSCGPSGVIPSTDLIQKADILEKLGKTIQAVTLYESYLDSANGTNDDAYTNAANRAALLWLHLGNFEKARLHFDTVLRICARVEAMNPTATEMNALRGKAAVLIRNGLYENATSVCQSILRAAKRSAAHQHEIRALLDVACARAFLSELVPVAEFETALRIATTVDDRVMQSLALSHQGEHCERRSQFAAALERYKQVCEIYTLCRQSETATHLTVLACKCQMRSALCQLEMGEADLAEIQCQEALQTALALGRPDIECECRVAKAVLHWSLDDLQTAADQLTAASHLVEHIKPHETVSDLLKAGYLVNHETNIALLQLVINLELHSSMNHILQSVKEYTTAMATTFFRMYGYESCSENVESPQDGGVNGRTYFVNVTNDIALKFRTFDNTISNVQLLRSCNPVETDVPHVLQFSSKAVSTVVDRLLNAMVIPAPDDVIESYTEIVAPQHIIVPQQIAKPATLSVVVIDVAGRRRNDFHSIATHTTRSSALFVTNLSEPEQEEWKSIPELFGARFATDNSFLTENCVQHLNDSALIYMHVDGAHRDLTITPENILRVNLSRATVLISLDGFPTSDIPSVTDIARACHLAGCPCVIVLENKNVDCQLKLLTKLKEGKSVKEAFTQLPDAGGNATLIGTDEHICFFSQRPLGVGFREMLKYPDDCREALRVILHLVEKSLQRINSGHHDSAMYTSENSVRSKIGPEVKGWSELLERLGFQRQTTSQDTSLYFPDSNKWDILTKGSQILQSLLGLPQMSLVAFGQLENSTIMQTYSLLQSLSVQVTQTIDVVFETSLRTVLYNQKGVSSLLASLGFDKMDETPAAVRVTTIRLELTRKKLESALSAFNGVFEDILSENRNAVCKLSPSKETDKPTDVARTPEMNRDSIRERELEITDMSGIESEFPFDNAERTNSNTMGNSKNRRRQRRRGSGATLTGYASESELKASRSAKPRNYYSDDEFRQIDRSMALRRDDSHDDLLTCTARVLAVEEHDSPGGSGGSDLGDSFYENDALWKNANNNPMQKAYVLPAKIFEPTTDTEENYRQNRNDVFNNGLLLRARPTVSDYPPVVNDNNSPNAVMNAGRQPPPYRPTESTTATATHYSAVKAYSVNTTEAHALRAAASKLLGKRTK